MQVNKLKKSLSFLYFTKMGLNSPFFFVQEKQVSVEKKRSSHFSKTIVPTLFKSPILSNSQLKYPLQFTFIKTFVDLFSIPQKTLFISFKEFIIIENSSYIQRSLCGLNTYCNMETFFNQDQDFAVYTHLFSRR